VSGTGATHSGYYAWLKQPVSRREQDNARLLRLIRAPFMASHGIYGSPRVFLELREAGETCSKHRVARLMRLHKIRPVRGYKVRYSSPPPPAQMTTNLLQRNFNVAQPHKAWVTDITCIRTWQGWPYLAVVLDFTLEKSLDGQRAQRCAVNSCWMSC